MSDWAIHEGDALAVLPTLEGGFDAVITDPPYGIAYQSARRTDRRERHDRIANDDAPFVWWLVHAARLLKDGGCLLCFCRWDVAEAFRLAIGWAGLKVGAQLVWDREAHGLGDLAGCPAPQHDTVWFATKGRFTFPGSRPKSVVRSMRLSGKDLTHPNEKPLALMRELVGDYTAPGERVLDPFAGSGVTGQACVLEGRRFVGVELSAEYAAAARRRLQEAAAPPLFAQGGMFAGGDA